MWIRAVAGEGRYKKYYHHLQRIGKQEKTIQEKYDQLLIEMVKEVLPELKTFNKPIQLLFDRGYVSEEVFKAMAQLGGEIITRFKSNVNLYKMTTLPQKKRPGRP